MDGHPELTKRWEERWPGCRPIGHELRLGAPSRWIRFHSLPGSKRYAETAAERAEVLARHNTVLEELIGGPNDDRGSEALLVITCAWGSAHEREREPDLVAADRSATYWRSVLQDDDPGFENVWTHLWISHRPWSPGSLDRILLLVAEWATAGVIIAPPSLDWLYHPYDGGADVIAPSTAFTDQLAIDHEEWLSAHPQGL